MKPPTIILMAGLLALAAGCDWLVPGTGGTIDERVYNIEGDATFVEIDGSENTATHDQHVVYPPPESK